MAFATWLLPESTCSVAGFSLLLSELAIALLACAFLAFTRARASATADFSDLAAAVPEFILALRASAAFLCFSARAIFSRSSLSFRASNLTLAFSAFISSNFC